MIEQENRIVNKYLSLENTKAMKGICAILVVLFHLQDKLLFIADSRFLTNLFYCFGYMPVAMFFFFSGYGLMKQYQDKGQNYIVDFPKKRLLNFYLDYIIFVLLSLPFYIISHDEISFSLIVNTLFFGGTIVRYGWYWQAILFLYIVFYLVFKFIPEKLKIPFMILGVGLWLGLLFIFSIFSVWYLPVILFPIGIIYSKMQNKIDKILSTMFYWVILICLWGLFIGLWCVNYYIRSNVVLEIIVLSILFVLCIITLSYKVSFVNPITKFLGVFSAELYFMHGFVVTLLSSRFTLFNNSYVYFAVAFSLSLLFAFVFHFILRFIHKKVNRALFKGLNDKY